MSPLGVFLLGLLSAAFGLALAYGPWRLGLANAMGLFLAFSGVVLSVLIAVFWVIDKLRGL